MRLMFRDAIAHLGTGMAALWVVLCIALPVAGSLAGKSLGEVAAFALAEVAVTLAYAASLARQHRAEVQA